MHNPPPDYLASRLGIVSNKRNVPYGWELPEKENDQLLEPARTEPAVLKFVFFSVTALIVWLVFTGFEAAHVL
jgi:hypothetical protein